ncbi:hypothetical protein [Desulfosporosinus sp. SB140]|uniref:hypothetical protein n=1 Tax=Desulfosporosinus paludis TaxID=3115649 RepID=UPI00388D21F8
MDELIGIMGEIRDLLAELNDKIDRLTDSGFTSISDLVNTVEGIKGAIGYDLTDVCNKLDQIDSSLSSIDSTIMMKD